MSTVVKALSILDLFTAEETALGLTEIAKRAGFDKATARRHLIALTGTGFVRQDDKTKFYSIGAAVTRLSRIREAGFPLLRIAMPIVRQVAGETEETVHVAEFSGGLLATIHVEHPQRANRVIIDVGTRLPLHATASGMAVLSFMDVKARKAALSRPLERLTSRTETNPDDILRLADATRGRGYSINEQGYEDGVLSVAAPILNADGAPIGSIAIAAPLNRSQGEIVGLRGLKAMQAARAISAELNGE